MSEMVDRVGEAIRAAEKAWWLEEVSALSYTETIGRAAIEAMRELTDEMCEAAEWHQQDDVNRYHRAIDEALK